MGGGNHLAFGYVFYVLTPSAAGLHALGEVSLDDGNAAAMGLGLSEFSHARILANIRSLGEYPLGALFRRYSPAL